LREYYVIYILAAISTYVFCLIFAEYNTPLIGILQAYSKKCVQDWVVWQDGLIKQLTGRILQRALEAEMTEHLGYEYEKNSNAGDNNWNSRNWHTGKTVLLFNDQIISMYSFGISDRDIQKHLEKIYNVEVPPDLVNRVTNAVLEEARE
jgi:transposase-like protein